jgi:RNA polymerase sigma-70 factor (ECF subfamily)
MRDFEKIYRRHFDAVFRFALRTAGHRHIAEDITSEAFLRLYKQLDRIDETQLPAWLFTVVKNRAIDYWRRSDVEQKNLVSLQTLNSKFDAGGHSFSELLSAAKALKPIHRICLILRYAHGMTLTEICQRTGLSENQVKGSLQYGRELLRKELLQRPSQVG